MIIEIKIAATPSLFLATVAADLSKHSKLFFSVANTLNPMRGGFWACLALLLWAGAFGQGEQLQWPLIDSNTGIFLPPY